MCLGYLLSVLHVVVLDAPGVLVEAITRGALQRDDKRAGLWPRPLCCLLGAILWVIRPGLPLSPGTGEM